MATRRSKTLALVNRIDELPALARTTEELFKRWEFNDSLSMNINLVLEEALSNIIFYAFDDGAEHQIRISISLYNNKITVKIKDDGLPFDPASQKQPDISLGAMERPVGGLGIFLVKKIMDTVKYSRKNNQNILTLSKKI